MKMNQYKKEYLSERQYNANSKKSVEKSEGGEDTAFNPDEWIDVKVDNRLKELRDGHKLTLIEFSDKLKEAGFSFPYSYVYKVETLDSPPSFDYMLAVKRAFNITANDVFFAGVVSASDHKKVVVKSK